MNQDSPRAPTFCAVKAGTIFENIKLGKVIFSSICPAPAAATAGKISAFVMPIPHETQKILKTPPAQAHKSFKCQASNGPELTVVAKADMISR
jgi:hypothetical protein